ncbi:MAG: universal stress protein [Chloroflexota bacterium]
MFTHLLIPLDGSRLAEAALPSALALAAKFESTITLLRVVRPPDISTSTTGSPMTEVLTMLRAHSQEEAESYLRVLQGSLRQQGYKIHRHVIFGDGVADIILEVAQGQAVVQSQAVDVIVMSTHGRSGLSRWVFGSVADKVLRQAQVPVLLIRAQEEAEA